MSVTCFNSLSYERISRTVKFLLNHENQFFLCTSITYVPLFITFISFFRTSVSYTGLFLTYVCFLRTSFSYVGLFLAYVNYVFYIGLFLTNVLFFRTSISYVRLSNVRLFFLFRNRTQRFSILRTVFTISNVSWEQRRRKRSSETSTGKRSHLRSVFSENWFIND